MTLSLIPEQIKMKPGPQYHYPDTGILLVGPANKADVTVEGVQTPALVDTGAQVSAIAKGFCR